MQAKKIKPTKTHTVGETDRQIERDTHTHTHLVSHGDLFRGYFQSAKGPCTFSSSPKSVLECRGSF